ncbi:MAG: NusG domain II-containing protein [Candidatus Cloacimonadota bacterium]|nr:NusG domain II-containing protein [Candidatus Cloacimonadota bacterium]
MIRNLHKIFKTADIILIIFLLSIAVFMLVLIKDNVSAKQVEISYHNKFVASTPLNKDRIINIDEGIVVEIKDGKVRIKESTCKNQYCVKQGWSSNFPIICVPNEVSVVIKNKKKEEMLITK